MDVIVDVILDNKFLESVKSNAPEGTIVQYTGKTIKGMIDAIINFVKDNKIKALRIWSHGWTHLTDNSQFDDYPNGNILVGDENIRMETFEKHKTELNRLTIYFSKTGRAELRGCRPAKGNGKQMMTELAKVWGVEVHGSDKSQWLITWTPPVYFAKPSGSSGILQNPIEVF